jgi:porphobilinogen deaminase
VPAGDDATGERLAAPDYPAARWAVEAERAFLRRLRGGCDLPCGALARAGPAAGGGMSIEMLLATLDCKSVPGAHEEHRSRSGRR